MRWLIALLVVICLGSNQRAVVHSEPALHSDIFLGICVCMHGSKDYNLSVLSVGTVLLFIPTETTWHLQIYNHL